MSIRNLSKLIKKRSVWRQSATKLMAKIDSALSVNAIPWDEVVEFGNQLEGISKNMEAINELIEDLIEVEDYEEEVIASQGYSDKIVECRTRIKILRGRSNKQKKIETSSRIEGSKREENKGFLVASHDPQRKVLFTHTIGAAIENKVGSSEAVEKVLSGRLQSSPTKASEERRASVDKLSEGANKRSHSQVKSVTEAFYPVEKGAPSNQSKESKSKSKDGEKVRFLDRIESSKASTKPKAETKSPSMEKSPKKKSEGPVISVSEEVNEKNSEDVGLTETTEVAEVILRESKPSVNGKKSEDIGSTEAAEETTLEPDPSVNEKSLENVDSAETVGRAEVVMMEPRNSSTRVKEDLCEIEVDSHKAKSQREKSHRRFPKNEQEDSGISISGEVNDKKLENVGSTETGDGAEVTLLDPEPSVDEKFENMGSAKIAEGAEVILMELAYSTIMVNDKANEKEDLGGIEEVDSHNENAQLGKIHRLCSTRSARLPSARSKRGKRADMGSANEIPREPMITAHSVAVARVTEQRKNSFEEEIVPRFRSPCNRLPSGRHSSSRSAPTRIRIWNVVENSEPEICHNGTVRIVLLKTGVEDIRREQPAYARSRFQVLNRWFNGGRHV